VLVDSNNNAIDAVANCSNSSSPPTITIVTGPANGTASVSGNNEIIYTPNAGFLGDDTITYNGNDGTGSDNGVLTVTVTTNLLPEAPDGLIGISTQGVAPETVTGTVNVATLPGYVAGNLPTTVVSVTQGALGTVTFLGTTVSYVPSPTAFAGTDTFTYNLRDSNGDVDQGTVTVNSANLIPAIENGAITSDEDDVSEPFQPVITAGNGSPGQHTLAVTTDGFNGSCGLTAPDATGQVVYTPDPDFFGTDSCELTLTDGNGDSDTATISVTVAEVAVISFNGGSSALDPWSLAFLAGVPLWRRRRAALKLAFAASGVLALPAVAADGDGQDRVHEGLYLGAGVNGTSLQSDLQAQDLADILDTNEVNGQVEDFPIGGQLYQGWMFNSTWGIEGRWSATSNGETDIVSRLSAGDEQNIGNAEVSLEGWTLYGVANWPVTERWDLFAKLGYTDQTLDAELSVDDGVGGVGNASSSESDNGVAAALGTRWRFARHWAAMVEGEYLGVDFDSGLDEPWRVGLNLEYWFGRYEPGIVAPVAAMAVAEAPPPPPPAAPKDSDGDGVVDGTDQCPETPRGDRVGPAGCSCDVTRQLQFAFGSAELTDADRVILDEMAESLNRLKFVSGIIEGHTDSVGPEAYNQGLSERRAQSVADYLESQGIARDRMQVVGRGESAPVADNKTAEGRAQNRRVVAKRTDCET
jgi:OOP family OmpA-OmpF porin